MLNTGVPEFDSVSNLVKVLTNFIYICSVEHSATNFPQYDQYGFPPNMPAILNGQPELQTGENELNAAMPTGKDFFSTIKIMMVLTTVLTNSLGNYESVFLNRFDAAGRRIIQKLTLMESPPELINEMHKSRTLLARLRDILMNGFFQLEC